MSKQEKARTFESEALILPALKMILVENESETAPRSKKNAKKKLEKGFNEETVMRIIEKLNAKE